MTALAEVCRKNHWFWVKFPVTKWTLGTTIRAGDSSKYFLTPGYKRTLWLDVFDGCEAVPIKHSVDMEDKTS
jgi:hypothetical protein